MTHRGSELRRLIEQLRILSFGIDDSDKGSSSKWLLDKFKISRLTRLAIPGGNTKNSVKFNFSLKTIKKIILLTGNLVMTKCKSCYKQ